MSQTQTTVPALTMRRTLQAAPARVFDAWTKPEQMREWFAPPGTTCKGVTVDLRAGGTYRIEMLHPDGETFNATGTYREIQCPDRLVYTMAWEEDDGSLGNQMLVTVEFKALANGTEMVFTQEGFVDSAQRDRHEGGWTGSFSQIPAVVERPS